MLQSMRANTKYIWIVIAIAFIGGFLLLDTSGLLGRSVITPTTAVASVNGEDILATRWYAATDQLVNQQATDAGRVITLDERDRLADQAFEQLVGEILLRQEFERRGITVSDDEIRQAALYNPPPQLMQSPDLQTDGRFDPAKYQRYLASPVARQQGLLLQMEAYYRAEIPKQKLFEQVVSEVYMTDERLWTFWRDTHDSAQVSFVALRPVEILDSLVTVTDAERRAYYDAHRKEFERPARAVVSVMMIPRIIGPADSAAARAKLLAIREDIRAGRRTFEEVARAESADTVSGADGGDLGRGERGRFVPQFETTAYALAVGELSQPVATSFGYHLIRVDSRSGDTLSLRHILLKIDQSEAAAVLTDRRADSLARIAAEADDPAKFEEASRALGLPITRGIVTEGQPLTIGGRYVPSVAAWAVAGAEKGDISDLFDSDEGYAIARVDSVMEGGIPRPEAIAEELRTAVARGKKLDMLGAQAAALATSAGRSSLEQAAAATKRTVLQTPFFTRTTPVEGIGRLNEAVGAAFSLPIGAISAPVRTDEGVFVMRVDKRIMSDRAAFEAEKESLRQEQVTAYRQQRLQEFLRNLRESADVDDHRKKIARAQRQIPVGTQ